MKKIFITIFVIIAICLFFTGLIIFIDMGSENTKTNLDGNINYEDAYITSCSGGYVRFVCDGNEYVGEGELQYEYTGQANIVIKNGKIKKVYAIIEKDETAESTNTETNTEVNTEASVPSNGEQISIDYISVLLKNKSKLFFKDIKLKGEKDLFIDGNAIGKEFVASEYFNESDTESVLVYNDNYVNFNGRKYEGNFVITKQKKGFVIVNYLPVETYLKYVIPSEMPQSFESEALKTQAICARTFAYKNMQDPAYPDYNADLDDSTSYQVYNLGGTYETTDKAVEETDKQVIVCKDKLITCFYFSTSSGCTENMSIWKSKTPEYIKSVESKDDNSPYYRWTAKVNANSIVNADYGKLTGLKVLKKSTQGYVIKLKGIFEKGEIVYEDENKIRRFLGCGMESLLLYNNETRSDISTLPSACFIIAENKDGCYTINGAGFGHDIGMSQYGANKLAASGKKCEDIIKYYYKNIEIKDVTTIY